MICLKTTTFVVSTTVMRSLRPVGLSCDLLENYYLCSINNSPTEHNAQVTIVVICLKTTTFVVSTTVDEWEKGYRFSCDLLENYYLCSINNST